MNMVINILDNAVERLKGNNKIILYSDQGWHYRMKNYQRKLIAHGIIQSMSCKSNCLDNSVMENFFGILKTELLYIQHFDSMEEFISELHEYIYYYNNRRTKRKLKGMSPDYYRTHSTMVA